MVRAAWDDLPHHYAGIELDAFVVMPNHIHGIIVMVGAGFKPAPTHGTEPWRGSEIESATLQDASRRKLISRQIRVKDMAGFLKEPGL
jgi:hypothetical protein